MVRARKKVRLGRRSVKKLHTTEKNPVVKAGMSGGAYKPLKENDLKKIHKAALEILSSIGIADATPEVIELSLKSGCLLNDHGRLCFPKSLIEDVLSKAANEYVLYSRNPCHSDLHVGNYRYIMLQVERL